MMATAQQDSVIGFVGDPSTAVGLRWLVPLVRSNDHRFFVNGKCIASTEEELNKLIIRKSCTLFPGGLSLPVDYALVLLSGDVLPAARMLLVAADPHRFIWLDEQPETAVLASKHEIISRIVQRLSEKAFEGALTSFERGDLMLTATRLHRASISVAYAQRAREWVQLIRALRGQHGVDAAMLNRMISDAQKITGCTAFWKLADDEGLPDGADYVDEKSGWVCMPNLASVSGMPYMASAWERYWDSICKALKVQSTATAASVQAMRFWALTQALVENDPKSVPRVFLHYEGMRLAAIGKQLRREGLRPASRLVLEAAASCWSTLISLRPDEPSNYFLRAEVHEAFGDAASIDQMYADCIDGIARSQRTGSAASDYLHLNGRANAHRLLGRYYVRKREWSKAVENFRLAKAEFHPWLQKKGRYVEERYAQTLYYLGRLDPRPDAMHSELKEALEIFAGLGDKNPRFIWAFVQRGDCEFSLGMYREAEQSFEHVKESRPRDYVGYDRLRTLYAWQGRVDESARMTSRLTDLATQKQDTVAAKRCQVLREKVLEMPSSYEKYDSASLNFAEEVERLMKMRRVGPLSTEINQQFEVVNAIDPIGQDVDPGVVVKSETNELDVN